MDLAEIQRQIAASQKVSPKVDLVIGSYPIWSRNPYPANKSWNDARSVNSFLARHHEESGHTFAKLGLDYLRGDNAKGKTLAGELQEYLDECRNLGQTSTSNVFITSSGIDNRLKPALTPDQIKEYELTNLIQLQGNVRGLPINALPEEYRKRFGNYSSSRYDTDQNLLFAAVVIFNNSDYFVGGAPILFDPKFKKEFPKEATQLARAYSARIKNEIPTYPPNRIEEPTRVLEKIASEFKF